MPMAIVACIVLNVRTYEYFLFYYLDNFEPDSMNKSHGFMDISKDNNVSVSFPNLNSVSIFSLPFETSIGSALAVTHCAFFPH